NRIHPPSHHEARLGGGDQESGGRGGNEDVAHGWCRQGSRRPDHIGGSAASRGRRPLMAMVIPFLNLVKKAKEKFDARKRSPTIAPLPSVEDKPEADKLAKRVTPYAVRTMTPEPSGPALAAASTMAGRRISLNRAAPGSPQDLSPSVVVTV